MAEVRKEWLERDYYKDLDLTKSASDSEISSTYKKLVRKLHPDRNPGNKRAEDRFKEVSSAYDVIGNPDTRKQYDQARQAGVFGAGMGDGQKYQQGGQHFEFNINNLEDLFSNMSGGFSVPLRGNDYETNIRLTFDESIKGTTKSVQGFAGKPVKVKLPAGVFNRQRIKVAGRGGPGAQGGPGGDLFVQISVEEHDIFGRKGDNLTLDFPISFSKATLGGSIKIPTYGGDLVEMKIPAGTSSGTKFRIKGRGAKGKTGDLIVKVVIEVPKKLSSEQKKVVEKLGEVLSEPKSTPKPKKKSKK